MRYVCLAYGSDKVRPFSSKRMNFGLFLFVSPFYFTILLSFFLFHPILLYNFTLSVFRPSLVVGENRTLE